MASSSLARKFVILSGRNCAGSSRLSVSTVGRQAYNGCQFQVVQTRQSHFKTGGRQHPLKPVDPIVTPISDPTLQGEVKYADHLGRQQNHIWSEGELVTAMSNLYHHKPQKISDYLMRGVVSFVGIFVFDSGIRVNKN
jgi:hypothetical protein